MVLYYLFTFIFLANAEFISPPGLFPANHGATIVELPNKTLLSCWYAGSREGGEDVQIFCSRSDLIGQKWSDPFVAVAVGEKAKGAWLKNNTLGNPSLVLDGSGTLWLFYVTRSFGGWAMSRVDYKVSADFGQTWSESNRLQDGLGHLTRTKGLLLDYNPQTQISSLVLPLYREFTSKFGYTCFLSIKNGEVLEKNCVVIPGEGHLQPALVLFKGRLLAYLRDSKSRGILHSEYNFTEQEWSEPVAIGLPNPNSSVDVALDATQEKIMIVYNDSPTARDPLSLAESFDGKNFTKLRVLDTKLPAEEPGEFSYPSLIRTSDKALHLVYTYGRRSAIKHLRLCQEVLGS